MKNDPEYHPVWRDKNNSVWPSRDLLAARTAIAKRHCTGSNHEIVQVWCDASVAPEVRRAFGAYIIGAGNEPKVVKLESIRSTDAEYETMTIALHDAPENCILYTDLEGWSLVSRRWNSSVIAEFKEAVELKNAIVIYIHPKDRRREYHACHAAARAAFKSQYKD